MESLTLKASDKPGQPKISKALRWTEPTALLTNPLSRLFITCCATKVYFSVFHRESTLREQSNMRRKALPGKPSSRSSVTQDTNTSRSFLIASGWQSTIFVRTALLSRCWKGSKGQSHLLALWQRRAPERSDEYLEAGRRISLLTRCGNRRKGLGWFCVENYILTASNCVGGDSPREDGD